MSDEISGCDILRCKYRDTIKKMCTVDGDCIYRSCEIYPYEQEIADLRKQLAEAKEQIKTYQELSGLAVTEIDLLKKFIRGTDESKEVHQRYDHEWIELKTNRHKIQCCDCGLVHVITYKVSKGKVYMNAVRDNRATAQIRRRLEKSK